MVVLIAHKFVQRAVDYASDASADVLSPERAVRTIRMCFARELSSLSSVQPATRITTLVLTDLRLQTNIS